MGWDCCAPRCLASCCRRVPSGITLRASNGDRHWSELSAAQRVLDGDGSWTHSIHGWIVFRARDQMLHYLFDCTRWLWCCFFAAFATSSLSSMIIVIPPIFIFSVSLLFSHGIHCQTLNPRSSIILPQRWWTSHRFLVSRRAESAMQDYFFFSRDTLRCIYFNIVSPSPSSSAPMVAVSPSIIKLCYCRIGWSIIVSSHITSQIV